MRLGCRLALVFLAICLIPSVVFAQASLNGVVRDASGAVLPGVSVEASSPALIEKVRTAVTDNAGSTASRTCVPAPTSSPSPCRASAPCAARTSC